MIAPIISLAVAAARGASFLTHPRQQPHRDDGEEHVRHPHRHHRWHHPALRDRLTGDQADVIEREHEQADADGQADAAAREPQRYRRPEQHEDEARHRQRELLVDLDAVRIHESRAVLESNPERLQAGEIRRIDQRAPHSAP